MEKLTDLYEWLHDNGATLINRNLPFSNPDTKAAVLCEDNKYGIFIDADRIESVAEETTIMLHEGGHFATGATHKVSSTFDLIEKHEYEANKWAVQHLLSADELDAAVTDGYTDIWSLAEYFGVTEDFMRKAVCWYIYGNLSAELYF